MAPKLKRRKKSPKFSEQMTQKLISASSAGKIGVVRNALKTGVDVNVKNSNGATPLHLAISNGHGDIMKLLLGLGADITMTTATGETPLILAARGGYVDMLEILIPVDKNIDAKTETGRCALSMAVVNGHIDVIEILIDVGANVNSIDDNGDTPLILASKLGHENIVVALVNAGADIHRVNKTEKNALCMAVIHGHINIVQYLIKMNSMVNIRTDKECTPLVLAAAAGHMEIVHILIQAGAVVEVNGWNHFEPAEQVKIIEVLAEAGIDLNMNNECKETLLTLAVEQKKMRVVKALIKAGIDINKRNRNSRSPLLLAAKCGYADIMEALLLAGADVSSRTTVYSISYHDNIVEVVLKSGNYKLTMEYSWPILVCLIKYTVLWDPESRKPSFMVECPEASDLWDNIEDQVRVMKECNLTDSRSTITLFKFLTETDRNKLASHLAREDFETLNRLKIQFVEWFPDFAEVITDKFNKGMNRLLLLGKSRIIMQHSSLEILPPELRLNIAESVSCEDLENLVRSALDVPSSEDDSECCEVPQNAPSSPQSSECLDE